MSSWKKRWEKELDEKTPALRDDVKNAPIVYKTTPEKRARLSFTEWIRVHKKRFISCIAGAVAAVVSLCLILPNFIHTETQRTGYAVAVEINPKAVFSVDKNGCVVSVASINADADVILSRDEALSALKGVAIEVATERFVDYAARLGYLDLNVPSAIRVSVCGNENASRNITSELQSYFMEKGAFTAVVSDFLEVDAFCARVEIPVAEDLEGITQELTALETLYSKRCEDWETAYKEIVSVEKIAEDFSLQLKDRVDEIGEMASSLAEIVELNTEIVASARLDYWTLQKMGALLGIDPPEELMSEMESLLAVYEAKYGKRLDGLDDALVAASDIQTLIASLGDFTTDFLTQNITKVTEIYETLGLEVPDGVQWCELPQSFEEYLTKTNGYFAEEFQTRKAEFEAAYDTQRGGISESAYEEYVAGLVAEYGSLSAYWENFENKF